MPFGFNPSYSLTIPVSGVPVHELIEKSIAICLQSNWSIVYSNNVEVMAYTPSSSSRSGQEVLISITDGRMEVESKSQGNVIFAFGKNKANVEHFLSSLDLGLSRPAIADEQPPYEEVPAAPKPTWRSALILFIPSKGYVVTPVVLWLNVFVFIAMILSGVHPISPTTTSLVLWGANFGPSTLDGQWWRFITCCFIHIGVIHLLVNMYALISIGLLLEKLLGTMRFLAAYIFAGIGSSALSIFIHPYVVSAGASGAIFGLYGVFLAMLTTNLIEKSARKELLTSIGIFIGINLLYGLQEGIDNAGHIGGLIMGLIVGYSFSPSLSKFSSPGSSTRAIVLLGVLVFSVSLASYKFSNNDLKKYEEKMMEVASLESMALETFMINKDLPKEDILYEIKNRGIYYWNESIKRIKEADALNVPDAAHEHSKELIRYCELRIKLYELLYKEVDEGTEKYRDEMKQYNDQIIAIIEKMKE